MQLLHGAGALALLAVTSSSTLTTPIADRQVHLANLVIANPWARATPPGAPVGGGYFTIANSGTTADRLIGGTVDVAASVEIHDMTMDGGVMKMRQLDALEIPAGSSVTFSPSGMHLMFIGLKHQLKQGQHFTGTLMFEKAGSVQVDYEIEAIGAKQPSDAAGTNGQSMPGMNMN